MTPAWTGSSTTVGGEEAITMNSIVSVSAWGSECSLGGGGGGGGLTISIDLLLLFLKMFTTSTM